MRIVILTDKGSPKRGIKNLSLCWDVTPARNPRQRVRQEVIERLAEYPSRSTVAALIEVLGDPEIEVRRGADKALAKMTGTYWDSDGRRFAEKTPEVLRSPYVKWLQNNPTALPEQPLFDQENVVPAFQRPRRD